MRGRGFAGTLVATALLLGSCGASTTSTSTKASGAGTSSSTAAAATTTTLPPTTLAAGESARLAQLAQAPSGYRYVDAPSAVVERMQADLRNDPEAQAAFKGQSAHAVMHDHTTVGFLILMEVDPFYAATPGFEEGVLAGSGEDFQGVTITGVAWHKSVKVDDSGYYTYVHFKDNILFMIMGSDRAAVEAFIAAAAWA